MGDGLLQELKEEVRELDEMLILDYIWKTTRILQWMPLRSYINGGIASSIPLYHDVAFTDTNLQAQTGGYLRKHIPLQQPMSPIRHGDVPGGRQRPIDKGNMTFESGILLLVLLAVVISPAPPSEVSGISLIEKAKGEIVAMKSEDSIRIKLIFLLSISSHTAAKLSINSLAM
ncbi:hypothetical protein SADUNF_Sadunf05G0065600 [Salix dunnii]|uniref:Uncharacterized protein n=1 Tax=Salix dunnii TaxID=1413687 RepID=A0A835N3J8_9ROSI|nr:hypothetical protein SADUNF_Sadunf05G0065600 [Salix dunnii]